MMLAISLLLAVQVGAGELEIAREALRDGLYEIARRHAGRSFEPEAAEVIVESYARENNWPAVLELATNGYYRALALYKTGKNDEALAELGTPQDDVAIKLKAQIDMDGGRFKEAAESLEKIENHDDELRFMLAECHRQSGNRKEAEKLWRALLPDPEAAICLGEIQPLRDAYAAEDGGAVKSRLGLALGVKLLEGDETRDEGGKLVEEIVHDAPDTPGAVDAMIALGNRLLADNQYRRAGEIFAEIVEIWPVAMRDVRVQEGRGWAYLRQGKFEEALEAFQKASSLADTGNAKALNLVKVGDCQARLGRGDEAMATYRQILADYGDTPAAVRIRDVVRLRELEERGREEFRKYNFAEAQKIFAEVGRKDPSRRQLMDFYNVLCLYALERDSEAEAEALKLGTDDAKLWLAKFYYNAGRWREARQLFAEQGFPTALLWAARAAMAENEFAEAIALVTAMLEKSPEAEVRVEGMLVQGQALIEMARFDEAVLVLERAAMVPDISAEARQKALLLKADSLFAMGADNAVRYEQALEAYRALRLGEEVSPSLKLQLEFKIGRTLEKLRRLDEALDQYYTQVVLNYRQLRGQGVRMDDAAKAAFSRAAFRLADEYESRGLEKQCRQILMLVATSDVPAAAEAEKRIERNKRKGKFL